MAFPATAVSRRQFLNEKDRCMRYLAPVDMEIIDRLSAGDPEKKKYYIRLFLDTLEPELDNLKAANVAQPQEPIRAILHKLKSQVQTIGAAETHALMAQQEQHIKEGGQIDQPQLDETCAQLSTLIENLQELLK